MKYFGKINDPKDIATKEYVDAKIFGGVRSLRTLL